MLSTALFDQATKRKEIKFDEAVEELTEWCDRNCLELNVTKTEELVIDFRRAMVNVDPIAIQGQSVEMVTNYE